MPAPSNELTFALQHLQAGRLPQAEQLFRHVLKKDPTQSRAWQCLGMIAAQNGEHALAVERLQRAIQLNPSDPSFHNNLGIAYRAMGHLDEAVASYRRALQISPDSSDSYYNLGIALKTQGKLDESVSCFQRTLQIRPEHVAAMVNLGNTFRDQGKLHEAEACYRKALELKPYFANAHFNLGQLFFRRGELNEAAASFRRGLSISPKVAPIHHQLGNVLYAQGKLSDAKTMYERALAIHPDHAPSHYQLGCVLQAQGQLDQAVNRYERAVELQPDLAEAHYNLANALKDQGRLDDALKQFRQALQIKPDQWEWELLAQSLYPLVFDDRAAMDRCRTDLMARLERFKDRKLSPNVADLSNARCYPPFNVQFDHGDLRPFKEAYSEIFRDCFPRDKPLFRDGTPRIGFVVTGKHDALFLRSMRGVLEQMSPGLFDMSVICSRPAADRVRAGLTNASIEILPTPPRFDQTVEAIRNARFDLLYYWEVGTDATNYFLPFFRLAPVQCTSWGIQVTSGVGEMDFYLSSNLVEAEDADDHYGERLLLADTLLTYQARTSPPRSGKSRLDFALDPEQHLYLCAQNLGKFHPDFDPALASILRRDPDGAIVITEDRYGHGARQLRERFCRNMADVADRIIFVPHQPQADYLALLSAADLLLDPPHFGGVNTTYDGFSLDKPIVSMPSKFHRGRYTYGCYRKMDLMDCVASTEDEYVDLAVRLGTDTEYRASAVQKIKDRSPVLFEDVEAVREHERLFTQMIEEARNWSSL